jgi:hypothetical protein
VIQQNLFEKCTGLLRLVEVVLTKIEAFGTIGLLFRLFLIAVTVDERFLGLRQSKNLLTLWKLLMEHFQDFAGKARF